MLLSRTKMRAPVTGVKGTAAWNFGCTSTCTDHHHLYIKDEACWICAKSYLSIMSS